MSIPRDNNRIPTVCVVSNIDGSSLVFVKVKGNALQVSDGTTGTDLTGDDALRDENRIPILMGVSSTDGTTTVPIYANTPGQLLVQST